MYNKATKSGNPQRKDPDTDKLFRMMKASVELVRDLQGRVDDDTHIHLRAASLGLMETYSKLTGLPSPFEMVGK